MLCSNRPEGFVSPPHLPSSSSSSPLWQRSIINHTQSNHPILIQGPHSSLSSPIPTTCFVDTILIPLPVWLALVTLPALFLFSVHHRKGNYNPSTAHFRSRPLRSCLYTTTATIYYLLIIANILMQTLEIVRLSLIHFGIALLPFTYVGLILGGFVHWSKGLRGRVRAWQAVNGLVWVGGVIMSVVKVVGLVKMGINGRKGSKYPVSDQVIDVAVMAGVYAVIGMLEVVLGVWRARRATLDEAESVRSGSPAQQTQIWAGK
ncbi:hypothetical protein D0Z07_7918 [Hyphodiscus hymeniophilus]|uniref:Uncharacterized protein n=1 Tax=Hyphodiscus hymeniophilus TaxID=353542 RepID=A0A9P6SQG2_9HELO|nr:hypothetical protein D0Z07_7918 [Hyphodiscus hymeniophilus]